MKSVSKGSGRSRGGMRNRTSGGRRGGGGGNNVYDSNGPGVVRIKGSPSQVYERYMTLAKESSATGDRVLSESLYQHAEHYLRVQNRMDRNKERIDSERNGGKRDSVSRKGSWNKKRSLPSTRFEVGEGEVGVDSEGQGKTGLRTSSNGRKEGSSSDDEDKQGLMDFLGGFSPR